MGICATETIKESPIKDQNIDIRLNPSLGKARFLQQQSLDDSMPSQTANDVEIIEGAEIENTLDWSSWNPTSLRTKKANKLEVKSEQKKNKTIPDSYHLFWEEENKRAVDKHAMAKEKHTLEVKEAQMKLELLQIEIDYKKHRSSSQLL
ncbi:uncharacterized protein LOC118736030 [Rhagoletis pomonella]|uniref:uncharacterized protein LOC118736030 n=1 Tax=Rhagoletis pomonella TaxID=28610 RepID=UPI00178716D4|nr:uncharacterized protein LOC118736030 [Rhagoletis pomonella]